MARLAPLLVKTKRFTPKNWNTMNPLDFKPTRAGHFIGPARDMSAVLDRIVARSTPKGTPIKLMLQGDPGIGKSALVDYLLPQLGADQWSVTKYNGTQLTIDRLEDWASRLCYRELSGGYKVLRVEELDKASAAAQVRMLTVMDDLPDHVAIIGTSNKQVKDMDPRFQSRFQVFQLKGPTQDELTKFLQQWPLDASAIARIAFAACGNVRLALFDAQSELDATLSLEVA